MTAPVLDTQTQSWIDAINAAVTVENGATAALNGVAARLQAAIGAAQSLADLKTAVQGEVDTLTATTATVATAIANVPADPNAAPATPAAGS